MDRPILNWCPEKVTITQTLPHALQSISASKVRGMVREKGTHLQCLIVLQAWAVAEGPCWPGLPVHTGSAGCLQLERAPASA